MVQLFLRFDEMKSMCPNNTFGLCCVTTCSIHMVKCMWRVSIWLCLWYRTSFFIITISHRPFYNVYRFNLWIIWKCEKQTKAHKWSLFAAAAVLVSFVFICFIISLVLFGDSVLSYFVWLLPTMLFMDEKHIHNRRYCYERR